MDKNPTGCAQSKGLEYKAPEIPSHLNCSMTPVITVHIQYMNYTKYTCIYSYNIHMLLTLPFLSFPYLLASHNFYSLST